MFESDFEIAKITCHFFKKKNSKNAFNSMKNMFISIELNIELILSG